jgi:glycosyltransferase involved in cell wall biosynthesis
MRFGIYIRGVRSVQGAEKVATNVAAGLAARGHAVDFLVEDDQGPLLEALAAQGVRVWPLRARRFPFLRERGSQIAALLSALASPEGWRRAGARGISALAKIVWSDDAPIAALLDYVRSERPRAVLSFLNYPNFALMLASRLAPPGTRFLVSVRNHVSSSSANARSRWNRSIPLLMQRCLHFADRIVAPSLGVAEDVALITGVPRSRIEVIHNPLWPELPALAEEPVSHPWLVDRRIPVIVAAGKLKPQKDFDTLLRAFQIARAARPLRLIILGDGDLLETLRARADELGVAADVDFPGYVTNPYPFFRRASLYVLSSAWEGLPNVLIEAMACGCPVVSTDCKAGPSEILAGGEYGRLVPVGAAEDLAKAMLETLDAPLPRERLLARSRAFALPLVVDAYEALLTSV